MQTRITTVTIVGGPFTYTGSPQTPATVTVTGASNLNTLTLNGLTLNGNFNPGTDNTYDLGSSSTQWRYGNFQGGLLVADGTNTTTIAMPFDNQGAVALSYDDGDAPQLSFAEIGEASEVYEYSVLVTSLDEETAAFGQLYRDRGDGENIFDPT